MQEARIKRCLTLIIVVVVVLFINSQVKESIIQGKSLVCPDQQPAELAAETERLVTQTIEETVTNRPEPLHLVAQQTRNTTIHELCGPKRSIRKLTKEQSGIFFQHMIVDDTHQLIYCFIPKVGSTNWKRVMQVLAGRYERVEDARYLNHSDFKFLLNYSPKQIDYRLKNYFKFIFVRHPLDRLYSAWHNRLHEGLLDWQKEHGVPIVKKFRENPPKNPKGDDVTLGEFFKYLAGTSVYQYNEHWMPFSVLCQPCYVEYNFIGVLENLDEEATWMIKHINLSEKVSYPTHQHKLHTFLDDKKIEEWRKVPVEAFKKVLRKFVQDFALFGYPMPEDIEEYIKERIVQPNNPPA